MNVNIKTVGHFATSSLLWHGPLQLFDGSLVDRFLKGSWVPRQRRVGLPVLPWRKSVFSFYTQVVLRDSPGWLPQFLCTAILSSLESGFLILMDLSLVLI